MSIEFFTLKSLRFLTLIGAIVVLFLKYYQWPDLVAVFYNNSSKAEGFLPKSQFFYLVSSLLLAINLILPILITLFKKLPDFHFSKVYYFFNKTFNKLTNQEIFENWINLSISSLNLLILLALFLISKLNSTEYNASIGNYGWFLKFTFALIIIMVVYPFFKIFLAKNE